MTDAAAAGSGSSGQAGGGLQRSMGTLGALFITVSCVSPSIAVFIVGSDVIRQAGTAVFPCFAAAAVLGLAMACVYGELGSAFPGSGGEYTIFGRALGRRWALGVLGLNLVGFSVSLALSGHGVATYLEAVWPGLPERGVAAAAVAVVTAVALLHVQVGAVVTGGFLLVELLALAVLSVLGFGHLHRPAAELVHPVTASGGGLATPGFAALAAATAAGVYAFNGYGAAIFFGEDMRDAEKRVAPVVLGALLAGVLIVMPPVAAAVLGAPDLRRLIADPSPMLAVTRALGGPRVAELMSLGVALAVFNTMIAIALMAGRQLYATGRDRLWPAPVSRALAATHRRWGSPWVATLTMGGCGLVGCLLDSHVLVLILGNSNVVTYSGLCLAALVGRRNGSTERAAWRMPAYPLPPLLGLLFLGAVAVFSLFDPAGRVGLLVSVVTVGLSLGLFTLAARYSSADPEGAPQP